MTKRVCTCQRGSANKMSLYLSCRLAVTLQQADDLEAAEQLDLRQREFLCPVCRRLGTALLPALAPKPVSSPMLPSQALKASSVLPDEAIPQQAGPAGASHQSINNNGSNTDNKKPDTNQDVKNCNVFSSHSNTNDDDDNHTD